jgi:type II secretory pathway component GspD/PulD (secretin)
VPLLKYTTLAVFSSGHIFQEYFILVCCLKYFLILQAVRIFGSFKLNIDLRGNKKHVNVKSTPKIVIAGNDIARTNLGKEVPVCLSGMN